MGRQGPGGLIRRLGGGPCCQRRPGLPRPPLCAPTLARAQLVAAAVSTLPRAFATPHCCNPALPGTAPHVLWPAELPSCGACRRKDRGGIRTGQAGPGPGALPACALCRSAARRMEVSACRQPAGAPVAHPSPTRTSCALTPCPLRPQARPPWSVTAPAPTRSAWAGAAWPPRAASPSCTCATSSSTRPSASSWWTTLRRGVAGRGRQAGAGR